MPCFFFWYIFKIEIHRSLQRVLPARQSWEILRTSIRSVRFGPFGQDRLHGIPHRHIGLISRRRATKVTLGLSNVRYEQERQDWQKRNGENHRCHLRSTRRDESQGRQRPETTRRCYFHQTRSWSKRLALRTGVCRWMLKRSCSHELFGTKCLNLQLNT